MKTSLLSIFGICSFISASLIKRSHTGVDNVVMISGPMTTDKHWFDETYKRDIEHAFRQGKDFLIGSASGIDSMALELIETLHDESHDRSGRVYGFYKAKSGEEERVGFLNKDDVTEYKKQGGYLDKCHDKSFIKEILFIQGGYGILNSIALTRAGHFIGYLQDSASIGTFTAGAILYDILKSKGMEVDASLADKFMKHIRKHALLPQEVKEKMDAKWPYEEYSREEAFTKWIANSVRALVSFLKEELGLGNENIFEVLEEFKMKHVGTKTHLVKMLIDEYLSQVERSD